MSNAVISGVFLFGFLIILLALGFIFSKKAKTSRGFLTGGASIGPILAAGMFAATFLSSSSSVGFVGWLYADGWSGFTAIIGTAVSLVIVGCFLVRKIRVHAGVGMETVSDLLADRYQSKTIRGMSAVAIVFLYVIFTAAELIGLGKTLQVFLGWEYHFSVLVSAAFTIAFVLLGGMFAVAINDTICGFLGIGGLLITAIVCLINQGGLSQMNLNMAAQDPSLVTTFTDASGVFSGAALIACISNAAVWGIGNSSHPVFLAQTFSTKSSRSVLKSMAISSVAIFLFYFSTMIMGGTARVMFPGLTDTDQAFGILTQALLGPVGSAILLTAVAALVISTIDSCLLTAGAAFGNDLVVRTLGKYENDDKKRLLTIRLGVVLVAIIGTALALIYGDSTVMVFQMFNFGASGAVFWVPIVFGLYWKRANKQGAIAAVIGGFVAYCIWFLTAYNTTGLHPVLPGFIVALILMVVVSLSTEKTEESVLIRYFPAKK